MVSCSTPSIFFLSLCQFFFFFRFVFGVFVGPHVHDLTYPFDLLTQPPRAITRLLMPGLIKLSSSCHYCLHPPPFSQLLACDFRIINICLVPVGAD